MKKFLILLLVVLPLNVFAYSKYIIPGGKSLGIEVNNKGISIVGFYKINNKLNKNKLKVGDIIIKVEGIEVNSIEELIEAIEEKVNNNTINLTIKRNNNTFDTPFNLIKVDGKYKTGLYVKDSITGIGTLTYIDPETKIFGALGHEIADSNTGSIVEIKDGSIFRSSVISIDKSERGAAGSKNAKFYSNEKYGNINKNTKKGIYGIYSEDINNSELIEVGTINDIKEGSAYILTVLNDEVVKQYDINIDRITNNDTKAIHFEITSSELLDQTGGIVQGMSGSPIIQNNKIIGAVTHVIVDNPVTGYGILITKMLEEGEK